MNNSIFSNKRFKYGSLAVAFTVVVIALLILFNVVFSSLATENLWYIDMTENQIYSVSSAADELLKGVKGSDIEIIFFTAFDKMDDIPELRYVYEYARQLENKYDYIKVKYINSLANPSAVKQYHTSSVPDLDTDDVVITNGEAFRVYPKEKFITYDSQTKTAFAFNGEYRIVTAIMQLTYEEMNVCFTKGHGETITGSNLKTLFEEAGFTIKEVDLTREDVPDNTNIMIINNPIYDFTGAYDEVNEIGKIDNFLDNMGNMMVFMEPGRASNLKNLNELLTEWGIKFVDSKIQDHANSISNDGYSIVSQYVEEGAGSSLQKPLSSLENPPRIIVSNAMPVEILWEQHNLINVTPVLTSSDQATAYSVADGSTVDSGVMNLMVVARKTTIGDNNEAYYNCILAAGTNSFVDDKYLNGNTYGNGDIIYAAMREFGKQQVPVDLDFKVFEDNALDVTTAQSNAWTVVFSLILPGIVIAGGMVVWLRRRHL